MSRTIVAQRRYSREKQEEEYQTFFLKLREKFLIAEILAMLSSNANGLNYDTLVFRFQRRFRVPISGRTFRRLVDKIVDNHNLGNGNGQGNESAGRAGRRKGYQCP